MMMMMMALVLVIVLLVKLISCFPSLSLALPTIVLIVRAVCHSFPSVMMMMMMMMMMIVVDDDHADGETYVVIVCRR